MRFKSYIDLEITKKGSKTQKERKKEVHEGKRSEHHLPKRIHDDHKCHRLLSFPSREGYEMFTHLNQDILVVLIEMEKKDWAMPLALRKNDASMGSELDQYYRHHRCKGHSTDD